MRHGTLFLSTTEYITNEETLSSDKPVIFRFDSNRLVRITLLDAKNTTKDKDIFHGSFIEGIVHLKFEVAGPDGFPDTSKQK